MRQLTIELVNGFLRASLSLANFPLSKPRNRKTVTFM